MALDILLEVERGRRLDLAFEGRAPLLEPAERRWVQELTHGVVRFRARLDHLLDLHLRDGVGSLHPRILNLLRMGAWQLVAMGSVPDYAAVSETVDRVRRTPPNAGGGKGVAGLANAVLRRLSEAGGGEERFPSLAGDPVRHLSTWGSHPRWLVERWVARYGAEETAALVEANNRIPGVHLRHLPTGAPVALEPGADVAQALREHHPALVQDPAAQAVVALVARGVEAGRVPSSPLLADLCAAPGGKGWALAGLGAPRIRVLGLDPSRARLARTAENARRLQGALRIVGLVASRGEAPPLMPGSVDAALVDAPCSGTGTLARHPDARWRLRPDDLLTLAGVQEGILDGAAGIVRPGGMLVYSTCTLEPEENEVQVEAFLKRHPAYRLEEALSILPHQGGTDGAFAARFRKGGSTEEPEGLEGVREER